MAYNGNVTYEVDPNKMDDIVLSLNNDLDSINTILNNIKMDFYDMKDYFKGDVADAIQDKWDYYNTTINVVKDNLKSYCDDVLQIKLLYGKIDRNAANEITTYKDETNKATNERLKQTEIEKSLLDINTGNVNEELIHKVNEDLNQKK